MHVNMVHLALWTATGALILFAAGAAAGYVIGLAHHNNVCPKLPHKLLLTTDAYQSSNSQLLAQIQAMMVLALECRTMIPSSLWQAIDELSAAARQMQQQLQGTTPKATMLAQSSVIPLAEEKQQNNSTAPCVPASVTVPVVPALSACEFEELTANEAERDGCYVELSKKRRRYEGRHIIHRCYESDSGRTLAPAATVHCHDLSVEGISFFWPDCPDFESLIIALSTEATPVYLLTRVMNYKAVAMHGEAGYLVGCRFLSRLSRFSDIVEAKAMEDEVMAGPCNPAIRL